MGKIQYGRAALELFPLREKTHVHAVLLYAQHGCSSEHEHTGTHPTTCASLCVPPCLAHVVLQSGLEQNTCSDIWWTIDKSVWQYWS